MKIKLWFFNKGNVMSNFMLEECCEEWESKSHSERASYLISLADDELINNRRVQLIFGYETINGKKYVDAVISLID